MITIQLKKPFMLDGKVTKELKLDLDKLTGKDMIAAEKEVRAKGDTTPSVSLSMLYHAALAARLLGCPVDELEALQGQDFARVTMEVAGFLLG